MNDGIFPPTKQVALILLGVSASFTYATQITADLYTKGYFGRVLRFLDDIP